VWQVFLSDLDLQWQYPALGTVSVLTTVAAWGALVLFPDVATDREKHIYDFTFTPIYHIVTILLTGLWEWLLVGVVIKHERTFYVKLMTQYTTAVMGISTVLSCLVATHAVNESLMQHYCNLCNNRGRDKIVNVQPLITNFISLNLCKMLRFLILYHMIFSTRSAST